MPLTIRQIITNQIKHKIICTYLMKKYLLQAAVFSFTMSMFMACAPKYGCPSNGKNVGAERVLQGGKVPKARKMRV